MMTSRIAPRPLVLVLVGVLWMGLHLTVLSLAGQALRAYAPHLTPFSHTMFASLLLGAVMIPTDLAYLTWRRRHDHISWRGRATFRGLVRGVALMMVAYGVVVWQMVGINALASYNFALKEAMRAYEDLAQTLVPPSASPWLMALALVFVVPVAEELLFRGVVQNALTTLMPKAYAVILTALLFVLFHGSSVQRMYVVVPGLCLSWVYAKTQSIAVSITMHMAFNAVGSGVFRQTLGLRFDRPLMATALVVLALVVILMLDRVRMPSDRPPTGHGPREV